MSEIKKNIVLVDSNALAHRAFHAYPATLTTSKGEPTNAIFGYFSMLMQVLTLLKPESVICVFDTPGRTFRDDIFDKYKANRPEMDESLADQIPKLIAALREANIQTLTHDGLEADDVIGSLAKNPHFKDYKKIIVTGDRDLFQVLDDDTQVYLAGNPFSSSKLFDKKSASEKMGFDIDKIILYKALKGDPSDNIPGVNGIGDVTAIDLIKQFNSLDEIYANLEKIKPAVRKKLEEDKEMAYTSHKLATIKTNEDIEIDLENFDIDRINFEKLAEIFKRFEFRSLISKIFMIRPKANLAGQMPINPAAEDYKKTEVTGAAAINSMIKKIEAAEIVVVFVEEQSDIFEIPQYLGLAISGESFALKVEGADKKDLQKLADTLNKKIVYAYNGKYLLHIFENLGIHNFNFSEDILLARFIKSMGVKSQAALFDALGGEGQQSLFVENKLFGETYSVLKGFSKPEGKMLTLYENVEKPLSRILFRVERAGIKLNKEAIRTLEEQLSENITDLTKAIYKDAGEEFNIASPKQLSHILFEKLGIKGGKKNKSGGFTTNEKFLMDHINEPIIPNILLYRELTKLQSTYTNTLIEQVNPKTDRIHTTFNQAIAVTGRLSSTNPNLQNIPTNSDWGTAIRKAFVPEKGKLFVSFDYSQQELRLLAEFSQDKNLIKAFSEGFDIHAFTASRIFNVPIKEVTPSQRRSAKTVNFGVVYGISAFGLADRLKIPTHEAQLFIDSFYASYPGVLKYFKKILEEGRKNGYVESIFGRRKNTELLNSANFQVRSGAEREVINFPLQGSASDIIKQSMIDSDKIILKKYSDFAIMILQVHDEIIFEVNTDDPDDKRLKEFARDIKGIMDNCIELSVPMLVDVKCGTSWADMNKITIN